MVEKETGKGERTMDARTLIDALAVAGRLKDATRHCDTAGGRRESVAEHSWRLALAAYFVSDEFPEANLEKLLKMCLIHDLGEAFTGDIPTFEKTGADEAREEALLDEWTGSLPEPFASEMRALYAEMKALETLEARLFKALDKLEAVMQHNEAPLSTWLPLEYELQLTYGTEQAAFSEYLRILRDEVRADSLRKIAREGRSGGEEAR